jgi:DNA (cytosine-5)-methyltransferase 1
MAMPAAIEVFSGCGGLSAGLVDAGFTVLSAVEINEIAAETYAANHPNVNLIIDDIRNVTAAALLRQHGLRMGELDLLAGCSPCQGFSRLRKGESGSNDPRNKLILEYVRLVRGLRPKTIFMENVPGLITTEYGEIIFKEVFEELKRLGYEVDYKIINTADYGVPQFRKRFVLLGSRYKRHPIKLPAETHASPDVNDAENKLPWVTVQDAFAGIPHIENGGSDPIIPLHTCSRVGNLNLRRIRAVPINGGSRSSFPPDLILKCHQDYPNGFRDVYGRMRWDQPSPTITGGCTNITRGRFVHPEEDRGISLFEASKLQTFPDNYIFRGNFGEKSLQIGNAVPVRLAQVIGEQLLHCINEINGQA